MSASPHALFQNGGEAKVAATQLDGEVTASVKCAGVYDANYAFFASSCPAVGG